MWEAADILRELRITPVLLYFRAQSDLDFPEFKGGFFRGGFGKFLREQSCSTEQSTCLNCPKLESCTYSRVFETPCAGCDARLLRKYPHAPHPFTLGPPLSTERFLAAGTVFHLRLTLLRDAVEALPDILQAFHCLGRSGAYGGAYALHRVESCVDGQTAWSAETPGDWRQPPTWEPPRDCHPARMVIRILTPLRLRVGGRYEENPGFVPVAQALLRRIQFLRVFHGCEDAGWLSPLYAAADRAILERSALRLCQSQRWSARQERRIPMDGVVGSMTVAGDLGGLAPYFEAGQWLHLGSQTTAGLGMIAVSYPGNAKGGA
jgi:hypothetical protein